MANKYQVALLELERKKLLERVTAAETAIFNRIQAISPEHAAERQAIEDALANARYKAGESRTYGKTTRS